MGAAVIAAINARQQRELIECFVRRGATSPEGALSFADLRVDPDARMTRSLVHHGVIREAAEGCYYYDHEVNEALRRSRRRLVLAAVLLLTIAGVVLAFLPKR